MIYAEWRIGGYLYGRHLVDVIGGRFRRFGVMLIYGDRCSLMPESGVSNPDVSTIEERLTSMGYDVYGYLQWDRSGFNIFLDLD